MPFKFPATRYRSTKTPDGEGGFTEALGAGVTVFGNIRVHQNRTEFIVDQDEDVKVEDIIAVTDPSSASAAQYRVLSSMIVPGTRWRALELDRIDKPTVPV